MYDNSKPLEGRFWDRVDVRGPDDCWEWQAGRFTIGYGAIEDLDRHKKLYTHRLSYTLNVGEIPEGMHVMHTCDNPPCCNPAHLIAGTRQDNLDDMVRKGRQSSRKLKEDDVREIRRLAESGVSRDELAEKYSLHRYSVHRILTGKTWSNVR